MSVTANLKTSIGKLAATLQQHFDNRDLVDGKLLWDGEILNIDRTLDSYQAEADEFLELFGPVDWMRSQYGD